MSHDVHTHEMVPTMLQKAAGLVGAVFLLVGVAGFIPGLTTDFNRLELFGHESEAALLGIFHVSILHNVVHVAFGVAGVAMARSWAGSRSYLIGGGVIYLALAAYGAVIDRHSEANFVPVNVADNWLHLALGAAMIALGVVLGKRTA